MEENSFPRLARDTIILLSLILTPGLVEAEDRSPRGTLRFVNGDFVEGHLHPSDRAQIRWASPAFEQPLAFTLTGVASIEFDPGSSTGRVFDHRVVLRNGDYFFGSLVSLDEENLFLQGPRHGSVVCSRDAVAFVESVGEGSRLLMDLSTGLGATPSLGSDTAASDWTWDLGTLKTTRRGANLFFRCPHFSRAVVEVRLESVEKVRFLLAVGAGSTTEELKNGYSLETWDEKLVAHRQGTEGFEHLRLKALKRNGLVSRLLGRKPSPCRKARFDLYLDAVEGRMEIFMDGKSIGVFESRAGGLPADHGVFLRNLGEALTVKELRVRRWNGETPGTEPSPDASLTLVDGDALSGRMRLERGSQVIEVSNGEWTRQVELSNVDAIRFARVEGVAEEEATGIRAHYTDGSTLAGELVDVGADGLRIRTSFSREPCLLALTHVHRVEVATPKDAAEAKTASGLLEQDGVRLHGFIDGEARTEGALPWKSLYAGAAIPVELTSTARISYPGREGGTKYALRDELYLRNGDIMPVGLLAADAESFEVELPSGQHRRVDRELVKAIRLQDRRKKPEPLLGNADSWRLTGNATIDAGTLALTNGGRAKAEVEPTRNARVRWKATFDGVGILGIQLNPAGGQPAGALGFGVVRQQSSTPQGFFLWCHENQISARAHKQMFNWGQQQAEQTVVSLEKTRSVEFEIRTDSSRGRVTLLANNTELASYRCRDRNASLDGVLFYHQPSGGNEGLVIINGVVARRRRGRKADASGRVSIAELDVSQFPAVLDPATRERVLTRRRGTKPKNTTELLRAFNGDTVRGRLLGLDSDKILFRSRSRTIKIPRARVGEIISLSGPPAVAPETAFQVELTNRRRLSFATLRSDGPDLKGESVALGELHLPGDAVARVDINPREALPSPYAEWKLLAPVPLPANTSCATPAAAAADRVRVGKPAAKFSLEQLGGGAVRLEDLGGKVVILDFWATWCGPCVASLPRLMKVADRYKDRGVVLLAVNQRERAAAIQAFVERTRWDLRVLLDEDGAVGQAYGVEAIPRTVLIDKVGKVRSVHVGMDAELEKTLAREIDKILAKPAQKIRRD